MGYGVTRLSECTASSLCVFSRATNLKSYPLGIRFDSPYESLLIHPSAIRRCASGVRKTYNAESKEIKGTIRWFDATVSDWHLTCYSVDTIACNCKVPRLS
jgi:hypothetical protein